jgi:hypothetical protein
MNRVEYVRDLDVDVRYRVGFATEQGTVLEFVVQLEVAVAGGWRPVVRYDTAHGFPHCDRYEPDGSVRRHEHLPVSEYGQALTFATRVIRRDWEELVRPFRETAP